MGGTVCGPCACAGLGEPTCPLGGSCPGASSLSRAPRREGDGVGVGVRGVMSSWGRRGGNDQLAGRAPGYAGEGQVGVWLKEGRSGRRGSEGGRGPLFVGIDLCGVGAGAPRRAPAPGGGGAEVGALGPPRRRGGARGDPRPEQPAAGRAPPSRSVKLNKEGICVFLTSAGYLTDHKLMYNSLWVFKNVLYTVRSTRVLC